MRLIRFIKGDDGLLSYTSTQNNEIKYREYMNDKTSTQNNIRRGNK